MSSRRFYTAWHRFLAIAVCLLPLTATLSRAEEKTYDLRGPGFTAGMTYVEDAHTAMKDSAMIVRVGGAELKLGSMAITIVTKHEVTILAVKGREATSAHIKIVQSEVHRKGEQDEKKIDEKEPNVLLGETVISERVDKKWKHRLDKKEPTEKQKKELEDFDAPEADDALFPATRVPVGHQWDSDAAALRSGFLPGSKVSDVTGKAKSQLRGLTKVGDEECAIVDMDIDVKGKQQIDGKPCTFAISGKRVVHRSLRTGDNVKDEFTGKMTLLMTEEVDEMKAEIEMTGPLVFRGSTMRKK